MKPLTLKPHEIRRLQSTGEVLVVREVPNPNPQDWLSGLDWSKCPYRHGDRLWVRETWGLHSYGDMTDWAVRGDDITLDRWELQYRADWGPCQYGCFWRSSSTMPRWASRFTVEVVAVECKGVQGATPDELEQTGERASWDVALVGNPWCWFVRVKLVR